MFCKLSSVSSIPLNSVESDTVSLTTQFSAYLESAETYKLWRQNDVEKSAETCLGTGVNFN